MIKYLLKSKIESIRDFILTDTYIFTLDIDSVLYNETLKKSVETTTTNIRRFKNYILTYSNNFYDYNLNRNTYNVPNECFFYDLGYDSYIFLNNSTSMFLYNFEERSIKKQIDFSNYEGGIICLVDNENTLIDNGKNIYLYNLLSEKTIWQYDLETYFHQPAQIMEGRVLVSNNKIIFFAHTEDWSNYATFVLDAQTGQVLNNPKETIFGGKMYLFDGFLWQKKDKGFAKMNPETFEITHYDLTKDLPTEIIDNRTMAYHNGIIAVSAKPERDSIRSLVLLFDTKTGKIIWRKEILHNESKPSNNENRRQIEEIQMNDKYLAVSTTGFSLYIFEKQDVESK